MEKLNVLLEEKKYDEIIESLEGRSDLGEEKLMLLGISYYANGRTIDALNKFNAVLRINPDNKRAANYVQMINSVLDFFNKDLLNP